MNSRVWFANATTFALTVALIGACTAPSYTNERVDDCLKVAQQAVSSDDPDKAEAQLLKAVEIAEENKGIPLLKALNALSLFYKEQGKLERCRDLFNKAKGLGDELKEQNPDLEDVSEFQTEYLTTLVSFANWERDMGHFATAMRYYAQAVPINQKLGENSPVRVTLDADYRKCMAEQETQERVENLLSSGRKLPPSNQGKHNSRAQYAQRCKLITDGYLQRDPRDSQEMYVALINEIRAQWGLDEPFYRVALSGLLDITERTGEFHYIDSVLDKDMETMRAFNLKTNSGVRIGVTEVVEFGNFIDTLHWQARVAMAKSDFQIADQKAERALKLTQQYYPESEQRMDECWRLMEDVCIRKGDYKSSEKFAELAIKDIAAGDPRRYVIPQHYFVLGISQLNQGKITQAVETVRSLMNLPTQNEPTRSTYRLTALRLVFEIDCQIDDYVDAVKQQERLKNILKLDDRLNAEWAMALLYQSQRLILEREAFAEYVRIKRNNKLDRKYYYRQWLNETDTMSYAALRANEQKLAIESCKTVESAKQDLFTDSLFYSKIVRVWFDAKGTNKTIENPELKKSLEKLVLSIDHSTYANRFFAVKPLVALANYLRDLKLFESSEKVYSCALRAYAVVPPRVDGPLIEALSGYHKLLVMQNRRDEAWQINARLDQKREKLATLKSITKDTLKQANLL
jgi:hypothetical protein